MTWSEYLLYRFFSYSQLFSKAAFLRVEDGNNYSEDAHVQGRIQALSFGSQVCKPFYCLLYVSDANRQHSVYRRSHNLITLILREIHITKRLIYSNFVAVFVSYLITILARYIAVPVTSYEVFSATFHAMVYGFTFSYIFEIANQTNFAEEDRLNKPSRPIPSGLLSVKQAYRRWIVSWTLLPLVLCFLYGKHVMAYMAIWQVWIMFCYVWPKYDNWVVKNAFTGISSLLGGLMVSLVLVGVIPKWKMPVAYDYINAGWATLSIHLQDFKDVQGDRAINRKTLPIILSPKGIKRLRAATATVFIASSICTLMWGWISCDSPHMFQLPMTTGIINIVVAFVVAVRVYLSDSQEMDAMTYYVYYFLALWSHMVQVANINLREGCSQAPKS